MNDKAKPKALIVYWSATGNTEKVANTIQKILSQEQISTDMLRLPTEEEVHLYDYDMVFLGAPAYRWLPPKQVQEFIDKIFVYHRERGDVKPCAPKMPGKFAVSFCTYGGPFTGVKAAIPAGKYMGQFLEHIGFDIKGEWYTVGQFSGDNPLNTKGTLGDIRGRPNAQDLAEIENNTRELISSVYPAGQ
jgi:flavodoxin